MEQWQVPEQNTTDNQHINHVIGNKNDTIAGTSTVSSNKRVEATTTTINAAIGNLAARTYLTTLLACLGTPDADGKTLYGVIGDFVARTNNKSLLSVLGLPDVAGKDLYTCLVTDRLDNATYGLSATKALIGAITDDESVNSLFGKLYRIMQHIHPDNTFLYPSGANSTVLVKAAGAWAAFPAVTEFIAANAINVPFDLHFMSFTGISANGEYEVGIYEGTPGTLRHIIPISRTAVQAQEGRFPIITKYFAANTRISLALRGSPAGAESVGIKISGHTY